MAYQTDDYIRLLGRMRKYNLLSADEEARIRNALGVPVYHDGIPEKIVKWLFAILVERPCRWFVDLIFDRLDESRQRRSRN